MGMVSRNFSMCHNNSIFVRSGLRRRAGVSSRENTSYSSDKALELTAARFSTQLFIANRSKMNINTYATSLFSGPRFLTSSRFLGDLTNTRANISAHYDLGEMLYVVL